MRHAFLTGTSTYILSRVIKRDPANTSNGNNRRRGGGARLVCETIRDEILELKLRPGEPLDETALSARFSLSRSPVREALVRLSAEGFVKTLTNRSTIVAPLDIAEVPRYVEALDYLQRATTRLAAQNCTAENLPRLFEAASHYDEMCEQGSPIAMSQANKDFHMAIAVAGGNSYLTEAYGRLLDEGRRLLHMHYEHVRNSDSPFPLSPQHFEMIEAISEHDETRADQLAHDHTRGFHDRLRTILEVRYININDELLPG